MLAPPRTEKRHAVVEHLRARRCSDLSDLVHWLTPPQVSIATATKKNVPIYNVTISITPKDSAKTDTITLSRPFSEWFDAAGQFVAAPFQTILASSVPVIGRLDPKRLAAPGGAEKELADQKYSAEMLDMLAASTSGAHDASTTGSVSAKKGGKRRKA